MVLTTEMSITIRNNLHKLQLLVAQLLWQWMEMNRNAELYQQFVPEEEAPVNAGSLARPCIQNYDLGLSDMPLP